MARGRTKTHMGKPPKIRVKGETEEQFLQRQIKVLEDRLEELSVTLATLKSGRKGARQKHTNLHTRTTELVQYLDDYIIPKLKTKRQQQCSEMVEHVRLLL